MFDFTKRLRQEYNETKEAVENLESKRNELQSIIDKLQKRQDAFRLIEAGFNELEEIGYARYVPTCIDNDVEKQIYYTEQRLAELLANKEVIVYQREYRLNGSEAKGRRFQENYGKNLLIGFDSYVQSKTRALTQDNYYKSCELIRKSFDKYNKQGELLGIGLSKEYLNLRLDIVNLTMKMRMRRDEDKARLREEKRRMKEQEKLLEDIAKEEAYIERERKAMDVAFAKALTDEERAKIKTQLSDLDKRLDNLAYRKEHGKAGWVYVISSPSLPGLVKIGATRRLNPTVRVKELSSSSLPFPFKTHGFVFSDNCFDLESRMHCYFDNKRVAEDREFFYITPKEAIDVLKNKFNQEVHFESEDDD